ncbi:Uncharacterised protein [uncultured archaeon]|nr:Uncharacterised protein [uncultured archaeon]
MKDDELESIIGVQSVDPSFIAEDTEKQTTSISPDPSKSYVCETCGKPFSTPLALTGHKRTHGIKKEKTETVSQKEVSGLLPENLAFLKQQLRAFGAKGADNILQGMADNPSDLTELRDLLGANENKSNVPYILKRYSNYIGVPLPEEKPTSTESNFGSMFGMAKQAMELKMMQNLFGEKTETKSTPEMDSVKLQLAAMAESNKKLEQLLLQQATDNKIQQLQKQLEDNKRESGGQIGSMMDTMKEFGNQFTNAFEKSALENQNKFEKLLMEMRHKEEISQYQQKLDSAVSNRPLQERLLDKVENLTNSTGAGLAALSKKGMEDQTTMERAVLANSLLEKGMRPEQVASIINSQPQRTTVHPGDSAREWQKLQEVANKEAQPPEPQPQIKPEVKSQPEPETQAEAIKFNAGD